ncbi:DUF397 domain-containing protein [Trebonia sp.]|uniref:DUF397 domain-containing protein n=1 Tax=Trebonia sp. TaxID=2767075 RepID=UPI002637BB86|nr:DUF397 domain-containing protein [Trebonia sp.]
MAGNGAVYNGMPAGDLDVQWRSVGGAARAAGPAGPGAGVEMAKLPDGQIAVRNSADPDGPALIYTRAEIEALIGGAQDGDFDALLA